jgi:hypothetical protein
VNVDPRRSLCTKPFCLWVEPHDQQAQRLTTTHLFASNGHMKTAWLTRLYQKADSVYDQYTANLYAPYAAYRLLLSTSIHLRVF